MSWTNSYSHTLALAIDRFFAAVLFNQPDVTISSLCWVVLNANTDPVAFKALGLLKLYSWQAWFLLYVGRGLEFVSKGHCETARVDDVITGNHIIALLSKGETQ